MQRTILSQWFLFLVPDLKILRSHIVSLLCVSGALVDLEFFLCSYLSLLFVSLCFYPFFFFFFPFLFIWYLFLSVDQSPSLIRCFCRVTHTSLFSPPFTANSGLGILFFAIKAIHLNNSRFLSFCPPFLFTDRPLVQASLSFFLSLDSIVRPTEHSNLFVVLITHLCYRAYWGIIRY